MESFRKAAGKETCFSFYMEKGKLSKQLFWLLSFTMVAKRNTFSVELLLPWKKTSEKSSNKKNPASPWKCAILLTFLAKKSNLQYTLRCYTSLLHFAITSSHYNPSCITPSLLSIIFIISMLIISIVYCPNYTSLLLHFIITHLVNTFYN